MLINKVTSLYEALDYEPQLQDQSRGNVRLYHRIEGADHAFELVWVLEAGPNRTDYDQFAYCLSHIANKPGSKRQRIVGADASLIAASSEYRLSSDVGRHTWESLVNDLFHSDRFCDKVELDYAHYAATLSEHMQGISGRKACRYGYIDQRITDRSSNWTGLVSGQFFEQILLPTSDSPLLVLVQAPAGYGKTAFSYQIAHLMAKRHQITPTSPFPLFVPFSKYRRFGGVRDILRAEIEELKLYGVNSRALLELVHDGKAVVILDGFDELMAEVGKKSAKSNLAAIAELLAGRARVALTSRSAFLSTSLEVAEMMDSRVSQDSVTVLDLVPFGAPEVRAYLRSLFLADATIDRAIELIESQPYVHSLCRSPLMLNTVAELAAESNPESPSIYFLYDRHVDVLCDRERERQKHDLTTQMQRRFLSGIAKSMYADNAHHYDAGTLALFWDTEGAQTLLSAGYAPEDLDGLRTKLMCHALFDSATSDVAALERGGIQFLHPSFRDYFVAKQLSEMLGRPGWDKSAAWVTRRPIGNDLSEFVASRIEELTRILSLFLSDRENGVRNALAILMAAIEAAIITPSEAEDNLAIVLGGSRLDGNLSGLRLVNLHFTGWDFASSSFNDCQLVCCEFANCKMELATFFGVLFSDTILQGSTFGAATGLNGVAVVVENREIERLYDNREIRVWLHNLGADVKIDDLPILSEDSISTPAEDLLLHVFSKFFPTGSDNEPRFRRVTTFLTGLPPHRKEYVGRAVDWLRRHGVLVAGPTVRSREDIVGLAQEWREDIRSYTRDGVASATVRQLIGDAKSLVQ